MFNNLFKKKPTNENVHLLGVKVQDTVSIKSNDEFSESFESRNTTYKTKKKSWFIFIVVASILVSTVIFIQIRSYNNDRKEEKQHKVKIEQKIITLTKKHDLLDSSLSKGKEYFISLATTAPNRNAYLDALDAVNETEFQNDLHFAKLNYNYYSHLYEYDSWYYSHLGTFDPVCFDQNLFKILNVLMTVYNDIYNSSFALKNLASDDLKAMEREDLQTWNDNVAIFNEEQEKYIQLQQYKDELENELKRAMKILRNEITEVNDELDTLKK
ncbi:MAG: hypothetical protein K0R71_1686 [Bacillales bacterium]|jgi:flagellar basal body-associated protein FliL|nr:hypothetical protein [Bacillales bacterium]